MNDTTSTPSTKKQEAELLADSILRAAGSGLRHYSMPKTRDAILLAAQQGLDTARAGLLEALDYLLEQTIDQDLKYGIGLSEGEKDARQRALAAIAEAKGLAA
jgi:hypothetical protein